MLLEQKLATLNLKWKMHDIVKLRIHGQTVNISVPNVKSLEESRERSKKIAKYERFLNKLFNK